MIKHFVFIILICCLYSCSNSKQETTNKLQLSDSLFALKNLGYADINRTKFIDNGLYTDSTKKVEFIPLDSFYIEKILAPILKQELGVDKDYVKSFMYSYFISIQEKIGNNRPLIIWSSGDDYESMILAIVDSTLKPVSYLVLSGGIFAGPYEVDDSLSSWGEDKYSIINDKRIESYTINAYVWTNSQNDTAIIDSIIYHSEILENGMIITNKVDSIRFSKTIKK
jgi:hypothetical protein